MAPVGQIWDWLQGQFRPEFFGVKNPVYEPWRDVPRWQPLVAGGAMAVGGMAVGAFGGAEISGLSAFYDATVIKGGLGAGLGGIAVKSAVMGGAFGFSAYFLPFISSYFVQHGLIDETQKENLRLQKELIDYRERYERDYRSWAVQMEGFKSQNIMMQKDFEVSRWKDLFDYQSAYWQGVYQDRARMQYWGSRPYQTGWVDYGGYGS